MYPSKNKIRGEKKNLLCDFNKFESSKIEVNTTFPFYSIYIDSYGSPPAKHLHSKYFVNDCLTSLNQKPSLIVHVSTYHFHHKTNPHHFEISLHVLI